MLMAKAMQDAAGTFPYSLMRSCASGVACTPDGTLVLVATSAGLQVVDAATNKVVRTLPDLLGGTGCRELLMGSRANVDDDDFDKLAPRSFPDWFTPSRPPRDCRLVCVDLETWQIVKEASCASW